MGSRFDDLDRFLPPAARPPQREAPPGGSSELGHGASRRFRRRTRSPRSARRGRLPVMTLVGLLAVSGGLSLARSEWHERAGHGRMDEGRADVSLGIASISPTPSRPDRARTGPRAHPRRKTRRFTRRLRIGGRGPVTSPPAAVAAPAAGPPEVAGTRHHRRRTRAEEPEPRLPAPPGETLFDCFKVSEHYMTIDESRVGQMEEPGSGWDCSIVGYVYATRAPDTEAIPLDEEIVYVFSRKGAETDPDVKTHALYRHSTGHDLWYSTRPADGGLVGYIAL